MSRSVQPNFVAGDGQGAIFPGGAKIYAGDTLGDISTGYAPNDRAIKWVRESDGSLVAFVYSYHETDWSAIQMQVNRDDNLAVMFAEAFDDDVSNRAHVGVGAFDGASSQQGIILSSTGESDFVRLGTRSIRRVEMGRSLVSFPGASVSSILVVNHNLGVVPSYVVASCDDNGAHAVMSVFQVLFKTATTFQLRGKTVDGSVIGPGNVGCSWIATAIS
jgi:hypothetical protein